jgi:hypothetical protein
MSVEGEEEGAGGTGGAGGSQPSTLPVAHSVSGSLSSIAGDSLATIPPASPPGSPPRTSLTSSPNGTLLTPNGKRKSSVPNTLSMVQRKTINKGLQMLEEIYKKGESTYLQGSPLKGQIREKLEYYRRISQPTPPQSGVGGASAPAGMFGRRYDNSNTRKNRKTRNPTRKSRAKETTL